MKGIDPLDFLSGVFESGVASLGKGKGSDRAFALYSSEAGGGGSGYGE
jgi:hypothetical protein